MRSEQRKREIGMTAEENVPDSDAFTLIATEYKEDIPVEDINCEKHEE